MVVQQETLLPIIVPQEHIVDFIDGAFRKETPEEYVRQEIAKSLVREYSYARTDIAVEHRIKVGSATKRVDLAVFPEGAKRSQETLWAVVECKASTVSPNDKTAGLDQLKSYMAACVNAEFGLWTNGQERFCFRRVIVQGKVEFPEVSDFPPKGRDPDAAERPGRRDLKKADSDALLFAFKRCHNYIAGNQGLQKLEAFWELLKLIFAKTSDERDNKEPQFYVKSAERQGMNGQLKVKARIDRLFEGVRRRYATIFAENEVVNLDLRVLTYIVAQLQMYSLLATETHVKGHAYEELVGSNLRGDRGEFFTPRNVCEMAVAMLDPGPDDLVLDPACGTGGFLVTAMNHVIRKLRAAETSSWGSPDTPEAWEWEELRRKVDEYATTMIVGIDLNPALVKATKMNMVMNNDGSGGLFQGNSLDSPMTWDGGLRERGLLGNVDMIFANPPFGSKITVDDPAILDQYDLARAWQYDSASDIFSVADRERLQKSQPPEILFIERCVQFLKPGTGMMAIVVPDGILGAPGLAYVREWILSHTRIVASIDLHPDTFQPRTGTQTSLLVLQRKTSDKVRAEQLKGQKEDYEVFMALANHVGHDKRGNRTYVRDENGNELSETRIEHVREVQDDKELYREIEVTEKLLDDNTQEIARLFRGWWEDEQ